ELSELEIRQLLAEVGQPPEQARHPIAMVLTSEKPTVADLLGKVRHLSDPQPDSRRGQDGHLLAGELEVPVSRVQRKFLPFTAWFNARTGLLEEILIDHTAHFQQYITALGAQTQGLKVHRYHETLHYRDIRLNEEIPAERFVFKPG